MGAHTGEPVQNSLWIRARLYQSDSLWPREILTAKTSCESLRYGKLSRSFTKKSMTLNKRPNSYFENLFYWEYRFSSDMCLLTITLYGTKDCWELSAFPLIHVLRYVCGVSGSSPHIILCTQCEWQLTIMVALIDS